MDAKDVAALDRLSANPDLTALERHIPTLRLFDVLGVARDEIAHSRLLASLFDPAKHALADVMLRSFLGELATGLLSVAPEIAARVQSAMGEIWTRVRVTRELAHIDIVVEVLTTSTRIAVAIENKIDAGEQTRQVARYQTAMRTLYPHHACAVAFLSPSRRLPSTAETSAEVPCVAIGYDAVLRAVGAARAECRDEADRATLAVVAGQLREEIVGSDDGIKEKVRELWKTHGRALALAYEHRPRLADMRHEYERLIRERFGEDARFDYYPTKGDLREIKVRFASWIARGLPLTILLYTEDGDSAHVRVFVSGDELSRREAKLVAWARRAVSQGNARIDQAFSPVHGWPHWRRVLVEEDYPATAALDGCSFDAAMAEAAAQRAFALHAELEASMRDE